MFLSVPYIESDKRCHANGTFFVVSAALKTKDVILNPCAGGKGAEKAVQNLRVHDTAINYRFNDSRFFLC